MTDHAPQTPAALPPSTPPARASRVWKAVFALSLALNLAVLGVVGGAMMKHGGDRFRPNAVRDLGFGPFAEALAPEDRADLRRGFLNRAPELRADRATQRQELSAILAALRAEPFDQAALQSAMENQRKRLHDRLDIGQTLIFDHVIAMDAAARSAFADRLEKALTRKPDRKS